MSAGDWVRLGATLSFGEGLYKVITMSTPGVTVRGGDGQNHALSTEQFEKLMLAPAAPKRRFARKADFFDRKDGVLAAAGYHVGITGLGKAQRREVLRWVFEQPLNALPRVGDAAYRAEWGESRSAKRVNKITSCLWTFAQNGMARREQPREAVNDWQEDYKWFCETYGGHLSN